MLAYNKEITITGRFIRTARFTGEWYDEFEDPELIIKEMQSNNEADIFTFWQMLPETEAKYTYPVELDYIAVLDIKSYDFWCENQIPKETRKKIKKAEKNGVVVKAVDFGDELVRGVTDIFNESPMRQGKTFWHFGKDFDTIKKELATYLNSSEFIGAYYHDELIGFIKVVYLSNCASTMQVISKIKHRDKAPTNALIAKMVRICDDKKIPHLIYGLWSRGTLGDFKRYNGFQSKPIPRFYVPLTIKGKIALNLHLHHGIGTLLPETIIYHLRDMRKKWYERKYMK